MGRRRSRPKNPRRGPGHNEQNRQSRESRQTGRMLHAGQETRFRYYLEQILIEQGGMAGEEARPFIQGLWTQGARNGIPEAKEYVRGKAEEGFLTPDQEQEILRLVDRYSTRR